MNNSNSNNDRKNQSTTVKVLIFNLFFAITFDFVILITSMIIGLSFLLVFHATVSHCNSQRIVTLLTLITFILLCPKMIYSTQIPNVKSNTGISLLPNHATETLIMLTQSVSHGLSFLLIFHGIGSQSFETRRKRGWLANLIAVKTKFVTVIAISCELSITSFATTMVLIIIILREFAEVTTTANTANTANIRSILIEITRLTIIIAIVIRITMLAVGDNTLTLQKLLLLLHRHIILVKY